MVFLSNLNKYWRLKQIEPALLNYCRTHVEFPGKKSVNNPCWQFSSSWKQEFALDDCGFYTSIGPSHDQIYCIDPISITSAAPCFASIESPVRNARTWHDAPATAHPKRPRHNIRVLHGTWNIMEHFNRFLHQHPATPKSCALPTPGGHIPRAVRKRLCSWSGGVGRSSGDSRYRWTEETPGVLWILQDHAGDGGWSLAGEST